MIVFTHAIPVAVQLIRHPHVELNLLPGRVRPTSTFAVGADTIAALDDIRVDAAFVDATSVSVGHGLATGDHDEAAIKRAIIRSARQSLVLCEARGFGQESFVRFAHIADVDVLITDAAVVDAERSTYEEADVMIVVA